MSEPDVIKSYNNHTWHYFPSSHFVRLMCSGRLLCDISTGRNSFPNQAVHYCWAPTWPNCLSAIGPTSMKTAIWRWFKFIHFEEHSWTHASCKNIGLKVSSRELSIGIKNAQKRVWADLNKLSVVMINRSFLCPDSLQRYTWFVILYERVIFVVSQPTVSLLLNWFVDNVASGRHSWLSHDRWVL